MLKLFVIEGTKVLQLFKLVLRREVLSVWTLKWCLLCQAINIFVFSTNWIYLPSRYIQAFHHLLQPLRDQKNWPSHRGVQCAGTRPEEHHCPWLPPQWEYPVLDWCGGRQDLSWEAVWKWRWSSQLATAFSNFGLNIKMDEQSNLRSNKFSFQCFGTKDKDRCGLFLRRLKIIFVLLTVSSDMTHLFLDVFKESLWSVVVVCDPELISQVMVCLCCSQTPGLLANQGCVPSVALRGHTEGFVSSHLSQYSLCVTAARTLMKLRRQKNIVVPVPSLPNSPLK